MSKGYPTREDEGLYPVLDSAIPEGACIVCKRRAAVAGDVVCPVCEAALGAAG